MARAITLWQPKHQLWIVTNWAVVTIWPRGHVVYQKWRRHYSQYSILYFSAKLHANQLWLPSEVKALSIAAVVKHLQCR